MREFILASGNPHKAEEFKVLFPHSINISSAPEQLEVTEDGLTYTENSLKKAEAYFNKFKKPTLADDSGLTIESMPEILGVQSARFAPEFSSYKDKNLYLLELMKNLKDEDRNAYFTCILCFYLSPLEIFFFEGRVQGKIGYEIRGDKGFGYDPIFIPERSENDGLSLAQLPEWKQSFSHRARAAKSALQFFKENVDKVIKSS
jgi:XTP/dITP diphosphohydrolase